MSTASSRSGIANRRALVVVAAMALVIGAVTVVWAMRAEESPPPGAPHIDEGPERRERPALERPAPSPRPESPHPEPYPYSQPPLDPYERLRARPQDDSPPRR